MRRLIPLSINLITRMIKTTSMVLMIGVVEVLKVAQQIIEANRTASPNAAFGIYLTVFILYFSGLLAHQLAGRLPRKEMEVTVMAEPILIVDHLVKATMARLMFWIMSALPSSPVRSSLWWGLPAAAKAPCCAV